MNSITRSSTAYSKVFLGVILATGVGTIVIQWIYRPFKSTKRKPDHPRGTSTRPAGHSSDYPHVAHKVTDFIGNTPLLRINCLSDSTGVEIWAKCEFLNPGGSIKDRIALQSVC
ncbi:hypothetical protein PGT21_018033 [Puccinia graminis f. sp. tritici]|uniref:Tryptophan synthase beta chain-like PALP domain-containing protein n=1 Tax=Puccinia graminis f. sp. tritici TaxID=56615 RepID=A0A5B0NYP5_PUCGR|nr:hypothetical protein PGT21_018033 [Puccinia graminis f. sp. tritici]